MVPTTLVHQGSLTTPARGATDAAAVTRLRVALARTSRLLRSTPTAQSLTPTQLQVLGTLVRTGEVGMTQLTRDEGLNPTMLSRAVGNLEAQGLVARTAGAADKRSVVVSVTEQGHDLHTRARAEADARLAEHLSCLSGEDTEALMAALPALEHLAQLLKESR